MQAASSLLVPAARRLPPVLTLLLAAPALLAQTMPLATVALRPAATSAPLPAGPRSPACAQQLDQAVAMDGLLQAGEREGRGVDELEGRTRDAAQQWMAVQSQCEGALRDAAQKRLEAHLAGLSALASRQAAGRQCDAASRAAQSLQQRGRDSYLAGQLDDSRQLFKRAEEGWSKAEPLCVGEALNVAKRQRTLSALDAANVEQCAPVFDQARDATQRQRVAELTADLKRQHSLLAETLWRDASQKCLGTARLRAAEQASQIEAERGTPWVETRRVVEATPPPAPLAVVPQPVAAPVAPVAAAAPAPAASAPGVNLPSWVPAGASNVLSSLFKSLTAPAAPAPTPPPQPAQPTELDRQSGGMHYKGLFAREDDLSLTGTGRVTFPNGDVYEGQLLRSKRHGQGELVWAGGQRYRGDWVNDEASGRGTLKFANGNQWEGQVAKGVPSGEGRMRYATGDQYQGLMRDGVAHGLGVYTWASGQRVNGNWVAGQPQGKAVMRFANGNEYEGPLLDGVPHGQGRMVFASGDSYQGGFSTGKSHGQGVYVWANGERYEGQWENGLKHGQGLFRWANGDRFEGPFVNDQPDRERGQLVRAGG